MKPITRIHVLITALIAFLAARGFAATDAGPHELIVCGREEVFILNLAERAADGTPRKIWSWQAAGRSDLPPDYHAAFRSTDECKPVNGGRQILITSSSGAVALVARADGAVVFYGRAVNAHSADCLPDGRIAVAASRDPRGGKGDALILFDIERPGQELWRDELVSGHGVVWDEKRDVLWALSDTEIRSYRRTDWNTSAPKLTRISAFRLPEAGGHELFPVPRTPYLAVSTQNHCWLFHRDAREILLHPALGDQAAIKCISQHPLTSQIAFVQADRPNWWSQCIQFLNPSGSVSIAGEDVYKVRWNHPAE